MNDVKFSTKILFISIIFITVFAGSFSFAMSAHKGNIESKSGVTPGSPVYFIDTFFEDLNLLFSFKKEVKSLIYIDLISERLSEVKVMLSRRQEVSEDNLDTAEKKIKNHISEIYRLLGDMQKDGKEVGSIAQKIDKNFNKVISNFDKDIERLISELKKERQEIEDKIKESSDNIPEAEKNNFDEIRSVIEDIKFANFESNRIKRSAIEEEKQVEDFMLDINKVKNNFSEVKAEFNYLKEKVNEEGFDLPDGYLNNLDYHTSIDKAESEINDLNFPKASESIKEAKKSVNSLKDLIRNKKEALFRKYESEVRILESEDSFKKAGEVSEEAESKYTRFISEAKAEFEAGNFNKAEELAKQAKEVIIKED